MLVNYKIISILTLTFGIEAFCSVRISEEESLKYDVSNIKDDSPKTISPAEKIVNVDTYEKLIDSQKLKSILLPPEKNWNICILIAFTTHSHRTPFFVLAKELLKRGHKVRIIKS